MEDLVPKTDVPVWFGDTLTVCKAIMKLGPAEVFLDSGHEKLDINSVKTIFGIESQPSPLECPEPIEIPFSFEDIFKFGFTSDDIVLIDTHNFKEDNFCILCRKSFSDRVKLRRHLVSVHKVPESNLSLAFSIPIIPKLNAEFDEPDNSIEQCQTLKKTISNGVQEASTSTVSKSKQPEQKSCRKGNCTKGLPKSCQIESSRSLFFSTKSNFPVDGMKKENTITPPNKKILKPLTLTEISGSSKLSHESRKSKSSRQFSPKANNGKTDVTKNQKSHENENHRSDKMICVPVAQGSEIPPKKVCLKKTSESNLFSAEPKSKKSKEKVSNITCLVKHPKNPVSGTNSKNNSVKNPVKEFQCIRCNLGFKTQAHLTLHSLKVHSAKSNISTSTNTFNKSTIKRGPSSTPDKDSTPSGKRRMSERDLKGFANESKDSQNLLKASSYANKRKSDSFDTRSGKSGKPLSLETSGLKEATKRKKFHFFEVNQARLNHIRASLELLEAIVWSEGKKM